MGDIELPEYMISRYINRKLHCMGPAAPADNIRGAVEMMVDLVKDLRHQILTLEHAYTEERKRSAVPTSDQENP